MAIEFGASTFLYERASRLSLRQDEAHRLAEHLVIARKLIAERPPTERAAAANELVTDRYEVRWSPRPPHVLTFQPELVGMRDQVLAWEPELAGSGLRLRLAGLSDGSAVGGEFRLGDGSWVSFRTRGPGQGWRLALSRVLIGLLPVGLLLLLSALMIRVTLRPLRALIRAIGRVGSGAREPVREDGPAEVRSLIHAFNEMQERIHDLIESRTQALAAVGHDLRTPLARLQLRLDAAADGEARRAMQDDIAEMEGMIESLLAFLGGDDDPEPVRQIDLAVLLATLVDDAADRGGDAEYAGPDHCEVRVRPSSFRRALANLIENGLHYGERVCVRLEQMPHALRIVVEDQGPGIPPDKAEAVLRPFVRLDDARARNTQGLGLGLAIVAKAVALEGGSLVLVNRPEGGLRAIVELPGA